MRQSYELSIAPGTAKNKKLQASLYIKFMILYHFNYLNPSVADISMYSQFLANSFSSPATVRNYISGAKTWVQHHMGNIQSFLSYELSSMLKHVTSSSDHIPSHAAPLSSDQIKLICTFIDNTGMFPAVVKPCLLIAFSSFLRASNMVSPTLTSWGGPHTLQASDIVQFHDMLVLRVASSKTLTGPKPAFVEILPSTVLQFCPVQAWLQYKSKINPCPLGPAFVTESGLPLTTGPVVLAIRMALTRAGHPDPSAFSFHSLRRGGAQTASAHGATSDQLMSHGLWRSRSGLAAYVHSKQSSRTVPSSIASSLAS